MAASGLKITKDSVPRMLELIEALTKKDLLVGIPEAKAERPPDPDDKGPPINNAQLGRIHEEGAPEINLPARPWLVPGMRLAVPQIVAEMTKAGQAALDGDAEEVDKRFVAAGIKAVMKVKARLMAGPFAPLAPATIAARIRKTGKGTADFSLYEKGDPVSSKEHADATGMRPLIDTGKLRDSVSFVVRDDSKT